MRRLLICFAMFACAISAQVTWTPITSPNPPYFNQWHWATGTEANHKILFYISDTASGSYSIYSDSLWSLDTLTQALMPLGTNAQSSSGPCVSSTTSWPATRHPAGQMWFDAKRGKLLILEGVCGTINLFDMWAYVAGGWVQYHPAHYPNPAHNLSRVVHHSDDDVYYLFGNDVAGTPALDWVYCPTDLNPTPGTLTVAQAQDGCAAADDWNVLSIVGGRAAEPVSQWMPGLVYDTATRKILKFGGLTPGGSVATDGNHVWTINLATKTWTDLSAALPAATGYKGWGAGQWDGQPAIALNTINHLLYLHDNATPSDWTYNPATNTATFLCQCGGPTAISSMAYDPITNTLYAEHFLGYGNYQLWKGVLEGTQPSGTAPTIATTTLPNAAAGLAYQQVLVATGTPATMTWRVTAGALPTGLALSSGGVLSGIPGIGGAFTFTAQADNGVAPAASQSLTLIVQTCAL